MISAPIAQAQDKQFDTQYYGMLRDTCKKNSVDRLWNRWFGDKQKSLTVDTCCMESVDEMEKKTALIAEDGICPAGSEKNTLECPSSKQWCEKTS
jgi:hypothetical protein